MHTLSLNINRDALRHYLPKSLSYNDQKIIYAELSKFSRKIGFYKKWLVSKGGIDELNWIKTQSDFKFGTSSPTDKDIDSAWEYIYNSPKYIHITQLTKEQFRVRCIKQASHRDDWYNRDQVLDMRRLFTSGASISKICTLLGMPETDSNRVKSAIFKKTYSYFDEKICPNTGKILAIMAAIAATPFVDPESLTMMACVASTGIHEWKTTPPQGRYWNIWWNTVKWALAFVAGFGSGKSEIMHYIVVMVIARMPWANVAIYAPTYDLLKLNNVPRIGELLDHFDLKWKFNKADYIFTIEGHGKIICRSMDNPARIIAYEVFASFIDELDTMPKIRAEEAWNKIISRNRQQPKEGTILQEGMPILVDGEFTNLEEDTPFDPDLMECINKCGVFTTPEGFQFTYHQWEKQDLPGYHLTRAATESNPYLPKAYIQNLRASYPPQLIEAYLNGEFVNLTGGAVYHCFNREENHFDADFVILSSDSRVANIG